MARDLKRGSSREEEEEEEEVCPLIVDDHVEEEEEEDAGYTDSNKPPFSSIKISSKQQRRNNNNKSRHNKYIVLCILITVVALVSTVLLVPVSQEEASRLTTKVKTAFFQTAVVASTTTTKEEIHNKADNTPTLPPPRMQQYVDYHTNRFDYTSSWCPNANCKGTSICYPCQRRWLIIVTSGRSASTTLTEMVHRLPGVRMTGENNDLIGRFETSILKESPREMINGLYPAWFHDNVIPEESFSCAAQHLFTTFNPPKLAAASSDNSVDVMLEESDEKTILGFKTIRLFNKNEEPKNFKSSNLLSPMQIQKVVKSKIATLNHLFPCARFLVNYRSDLQQQTASRLAHFGGSTNMTQVTKWVQLDNDYLQAFHQQLTVDSHSSGQRRSFLLDSTVWTRNISAFNEMLDWLGFAKSCHFAAALEYNTKNGYDATKTEAELSPDCRYLYD